MKKKFSIIILFFFIFLIFFSGCFTPNMQGPCCTPEEAKKGICNMFTPPAADHSNPVMEKCEGILPHNSSCSKCPCTTLFCVFPEVNEHKNQTIYVKYTQTTRQILNCSNISLGNKSEPCNHIGYCLIELNGSRGSYPICSERKEMSLDTECKTMLCGNIKYAPEYSLLPEVGKNLTSQNIGGSHSTGLYNAMCNFYVLDAKTLKKLKRASGVFTNTFRFGTGSSISDFEEAKYYFPLSDRWCGIIPSNIAPFSNDRYINYLNLSNKTDIKYLPLITETFYNTTTISSYYKDFKIRVQYDSDKTRYQIYYHKIGSSSPAWHTMAEVNPQENGRGVLCFESKGKWPSTCYSYTCTTSKEKNITACPVGYTKHKRRIVFIYGGNNSYTNTFPGTAEKTLDYYYGPYDPNTLTNSSMCVGGDDIVFPPAPDGNYLLTTFTEGAKRFTGNDNFLSTYSIPDRARYKISLQGAYWNQSTYLFTTNKPAGGVRSCTDPKDLSTCIVLIGEVDGKEISITVAEVNGNIITDIYGTSYIFEEYGANELKIYSNNKIYTSTNPVGFECNSSIDCISGICSKQDEGYKRGLCVNKNDGSLVNCLCYEVGFRRMAGNYVYCSPVLDKENYSIATARTCVQNRCGDEEITGKIVFFPNNTTDGYIGYALMDEEKFKETMFAKKCAPVTYDVEYKTVPYILDSASVWSTAPCMHSYQTYKIVRPRRWYWNYIFYSVCNKTAHEIIKIKSFGGCEQDDKYKNFPKIKDTYGWCEPCTFSTMIGIDLDAEWRKYRDYSLYCPSTGSYEGIVVGVGDNMCGGKIREYIQNIVLLRNRIDHYLKAGVMPILWYTNGELGYTKVYSNPYYIYQQCHNIEYGSAPAGIKSVLLGDYFFYPPDSTIFFENASAGCGSYTEKRCCWYKCSGPVIGAPAPARSLYALGEFGSTTIYNNENTNNESSIDLQYKCCKVRKQHRRWVYCYWTGYYTFLKKVLGNSAAVLVVANDSMDISTVSERAKKAKELCPRCIIAFYSPEANQTKLKQIFGCSGSLNCLTMGNDAWKKIDLILYDVNINTITGPDRKLAILKNMSEQSKLLLQQYGKPSLTYDFKIDDTKFDWKKNDTYETMKYLLENKADLVNSGLIGLFYKKWLAPDTEALVSPKTNARFPTLKDQKFCEFERAINVYLNPIQRKTIITSVRVVEPSEGECVECSFNELNYGLCNRTCENGIECDLPQGAGDPSKYRCPTDTALEPCVLCKDSTKTAYCNITHQNGSVQEVSYPLSGLTDVYLDVIAALPKNEKCCLINNDDPEAPYNYTYKSIESEISTTMPIRFPRGGAENSDCGVSKELTSVCGVEIPIKNYIIKCYVE